MTASPTTSVSRSPSGSASVTPSASTTATVSPSSSPTRSGTRTPSASPSGSVTPSSSASASTTPSRSVTPSASSSATATPSSTASFDLASLVRLGGGATLLNQVSPSPAALRVGKPYFTIPLTLSLSLQLPVLQGGLAGFIGSPDVQCLLITAASALTSIDAASISMTSAGSISYTPVSSCATSAGAGGGAGRLLEDGAAALQEGTAAAALGRLLTASTASDALMGLCGSRRELQGAGSSSSGSTTTQPAVLTATTTLVVPSDQLVDADAAVAAYRRGVQGRFSATTALLADVTSLAAFVASPDTASNPAVVAAGSLLRAAAAVNLLMPSTTVALPITAASCVAVGNVTAAVVLPTRTPTASVTPSVTASRLPFGAAAGAAASSSAPSSSLVSTGGVVGAVVGSIGGALVIGFCALCWRARKRGGSGGLTAKAPGGSGDDDVEGGGAGGRAPVIVANPAAGLTSPALALATPMGSLAPTPVVRAAHALLADAPPALLGGGGGGSLAAAAASLAASGAAAVAAAAAGGGMPTPSSVQPDVAPHTRGGRGAAGRPLRDAHPAEANPLPRFLWPGYEGMPVTAAESPNAGGSGVSRVTPSARALAPAVQPLGLDAAVGYAEATGRGLAAGVPFPVGGGGGGGAGGVFASSSGGSVVGAYRPPAMPGLAGPHAAAMHTLVGMQAQLHGIQSQALAAAAGAGAAYPLPPSPDAGARRVIRRVVPGVAAPLGMAGSVATAPGSVATPTPRRFVSAAGGAPASIASGASVVRNPLSAGMAAAAAPSARSGFVGGGEVAGAAATSRSGGAGVASSAAGVGFTHHSSPPAVAIPAAPAATAAATTAAAPGGPSTSPTSASGRPRGGSVATKNTRLNAADLEAANAAAAAVAASVAGNNVSFRADAVMASLELAPGPAAMLGGARRVTDPPPSAAAAEGTRRHVFARKSFGRSAQVARKSMMFKRG